MRVMRIKTHKALEQYLAYIKQLIAISHVYYDQEMPYDFRVCVCLNIYNHIIVK